MAMHKILIVDDEKLARQDIVYKVGASGYSFDWIMDASSAEEAMEIVSQNRPDILFTDIMMWGKSGLELIDEVKKVNPRIVTVVICGYSDFSFAQSALKLGVTDYLLKPVTQQQISSVLAKATALVQERQNVGELKLNNHILQQNLYSRQFQEQINALLSGTTGEEMSLITEALPKGMKSYQVQLIRLRMPENISHKGRDALRFGVQNIIEELSKGRTITINGKSGTEVVSIAGSVYTDQYAETELEHLAQRVHHTLLEKLEVVSDIGLSAPSKVLTYSNYLESQNALDLRFTYHLLSAGGTQKEYRGHVFSSKKNTENRIHTQEEELKIYRHFLESNDLEQTVHTAKEILKSYQYPAEGLRDSYVEMISILSRVGYRKGAEILSLLGYENISGSVLDEYDTLDGVVENLSNILRTAMGKWIQNMESASDVLVQVKQYINDNFADSDLCTKELSRRFCISLGYLSATYKKQYGITISKYIIAKRMEYASKLLLSTDLSVQNISDNCGFNNLSYFMRVFKAYYNVTPTQYRENQSCLSVGK